MVYIERHLSYHGDAGHERQMISQDVLASWPPPAIILGEPGMGKSGLLRSLAARNDAFVLVSALGLKRRRTPFPSGKVVLIDGLDELPGAQEQDPVQEVLEKLAELDSPPFFLSCRANDWRDVSRQAIREDYGREPTEFRLTALTGDEAAAFLSTRHGTDPAEEFVQRMDRLGIGEFYGNPLTLQLIDRLAVQHEGLPLHRADLYLRASDDLRQEQNKERPWSPLSGLAKEAALDAAGAASAALIITGSEAINLGAQGATQEGDLHVSEIIALPGGVEVAVVVSSMLFERREGPGDRIVPFHRAMAEFLAARWLAGHATGSSGRRLLALMTYQGGVPASLRGMHAWLAYFSAPLRAGVIAADPYGVLRYGDAAYLTPADATLLLYALEGLSQIDPWFASGDERRHRAPSLTQVGMVDELRRVLLAPESAFQLKSILLLALPGSEAAPSLRPELEDIFMSPEAHETDVSGHPGFTFHERSAAFDILVDLLPLDSWAPRIEALFLRSGDDDRRLAVESISAVGSEHFDPGLIARAALSYAGLLPGANGPRRVVESSGDLYILSRAIKDEQVALVLDALVVLAPATDGISWHAAYQFSGFVDHLVAQAVAIQAPNPLALLGWLRLIRDRHGSEQEAREAVGTFLRGTDGIRRAIQRQVVLDEARERDAMDGIWRLFDLHPALGFTDEDLVTILDPTNFTRVGEEPEGELFRRLVSQGATRKGISSTVRAAAVAVSKGRDELETFLIELDRPRIFDWERKETVRRWRRNAKKCRQYHTRRAAYFQLASKIAEGSWMGLATAAEVYLNHYSDLLRDAPPRERLADWIGEDLAEMILVGFEASLHRTDLPTPREIGESHVEKKRWKTTLLLLAGAIERALSGRNFEDLAEDVVVSISMGEILEILPEPVCEPLRRALHLWSASRPVALEQIWRLTFEPQLRQRHEHITGLYRLMRPCEFPTLVSRLAAEWLETFTDLPLAVEAELLDCLSRDGDWQALRRLFHSREALGYRDEKHHQIWLAIAFFADFTNALPSLDAAARDQPELFWTIRRRGWPSDERGRGRSISIEQLTWLVGSFRVAFPAVEHPMGSSSGDTNPWDATDFMRGMIRRLASDTSNGAVSALADLRDAVADGYEPFLKNACAQQLKARRDASFRSPALAQLTAVLQARGPSSASDFQAVVLDAIATVQSRMNRDNVDQVSLFYESGVPKGEEECRDALVILLRDLVGHGIDIIPEHLMPINNRADIVFALNDLRLPIEAKGQWHEKLWVAAADQLDAYYAIEWRANGHGIYLVFWFGADVPGSKKLRSAGRGLVRPETPEALREALVARILEHRRGQIAVVVLDVSRKKGRALVPSA